MFVDDDDYEDVSEETAHQNKAMSENKRYSLCSRIKNMGSA